MILGTEPANYATGDLNSDGQINVQDIVIIINCILDNTCNDCSDMNNDEIINIQDIVILVGIILDN